MPAPATSPTRVARLHRLLLHRPVVATLVRACQQAGNIPVHLVGGLLRDRLLGLPSRDYDAVVAGSGHQIAATVAQALGAHLVPLGGKDFAAYRVVGGDGDDWVLDLWDREDMSLHDDLLRRDFTVNAIALELSAHRSDDEPPRFVDPFGGVADLERRLLRATSEASFTGDALRVLRLPRLLAQLPGFTADPATLELARTAAPGLATVAAERVREELVLIFQRPATHRAFGLLAALGVYPGLWRGEPGAAVTAAREQRTARALLEMQRLPPRGREVAERLPGGASSLDPLAIRYTIPFRHLGAAEGSEEDQIRAAVATVESFRDAGFMTRNLAARVTRLARESEIPEGARERRHFLHRLGALWPSAATLLGAQLADGDPRLAAWRDGIRNLATLVREDGDRILEPPRLVSGQEVQELLGWEPGPRIGEALAAVERAQVEGDIGSRGEALDLLRRRFKP